MFWTSVALEAINDGQYKVLEECLMAARSVFCPMPVAAELWAPQSPYKAVQKAAATWFLRPLEWRRVAAPPPHERLWETVVRPVSKKGYGIYNHRECEFVFTVRSDIFWMTDIPLNRKTKFGTAFHSGLFCLGIFRRTQYCGGTGYGNVRGKT